MIFIHLKKIYDRVHKELVWCVLGMKRVILKYIKLIKNMYDRFVISLRTGGALHLIFLSLWMCIKEQY